MSPGRDSGLGEKGIHDHIEGHDHNDMKDYSTNVAKVVHTDGTIDYIDAKAIGGDFEEMPKGYFWSPSFIGTVTVSTPAKLTLKNTDRRLGTMFRQHLRLSWLGSPC